MATLIQNVQTEQSSVLLGFHLPKQPTDCHHGVTVNSLHCHVEASARAEPRQTAPSSRD